MISPERSSSLAAFLSPFSSSLSSIASSSQSPIISQVIYVYASLFLLACVCLATLGRRFRWLFSLCVGFIATTSLYLNLLAIVICFMLITIVLAALFPLYLIAYPELFGVLLVLAMVSSFATAIVLMFLPEKYSLMALGFLQVFTLAAKLCFVLIVPGAIFVFLLPGLFLFFWISILISAAVFAIVAPRLYGPISSLISTVFIGFVGIVIAITVLQPFLFLHAYFIGMGVFVPVCIALQIFIGNLRRKKNEDRHANVPELGSMVADQKANERPQLVQLRPFMDVKM